MRIEIGQIRSDLNNAEVISTMRCIGSDESEDEQEGLTLGRVWEVGGQMVKLITGDRAVSQVRWVWSS